MSYSCTFARPDDLDGTVPLESSRYDKDLQLSDGKRWAFYRASDGALLSESRFGGSAGPQSLSPQPQGFIGLEFILGPSKTLVDFFEHTGAQASGSTLDFAVIGGADDPGGGMVLFSADYDAGKGTFVLEYHRLGKTAVLEATSTVGTGSVRPNGVVKVRAGVTLSGHTLVVYRPDDSPGSPPICRAVWLDRAGQKMTAEFTVSDCDDNSLNPLLDGTLLLSRYEWPARGWRPLAVYRDAGVDRQDSPDWLAKRSPLRDPIYMVLGGKGYALRETDHPDSIRLFARDGTSCGSIQPPGLANNPFAIGRDGTLVWQEACTFSWRAQILR